MSQSSGPKNVTRCGSFVTEISNQVNMCTPVRLVMPSTGKLDTDRLTQGEHRVKTKAETTVMQPQAHRCHGRSAPHQTLGERHGTDSPLTAPRKKPTLPTPDFRPPELRENTSPLCKPPAGRRPWDEDRPPLLPCGLLWEEPQGRAQGCQGDSYYPVTGQKLIESAGS